MQDEASDPQAESIEHTKVQTPEKDLPSPPRIGILLIGFDESKTVPAIQHLLLHINRLQRNFEFEFLPGATEHFFVALAPYLTLKRNCADNEQDCVTVKAELIPLLRNYEAWLTKLNKDYKIQRTELPDHYVFVTLAKLDDDYYTTRTGNFSVIALGNWRRHMAPPTQVEFLLTLMVREAVGALCPSLRGSIHIGTSGCICDFTYELQDARQKVLSAFVCSYCREHLGQAGLLKLAAQIEQFLGKKWFGDAGTPSSPASISAKLGQHLFVTKNIQPSMLERLLSSLEQEGFKQLSVITGALLLGALVTLLATGGADISTILEKALDYLKPTN